MSAPYLEMLDRVEIAEMPADRMGPAHLLVSPFWKGVDRALGSSWGLPLGKRRLAERLKTAIESGSFYSRAVVSTDSEGHTYVATDHPVTGRGMDAELKRMGFR